MTKGYWVVHVYVSDMEAYRLYVAAIKAPLTAYGARYLTRGGAFECPEGSTKPRTVVIEFPSYEAALACYNGAGYAEAAKLRQAVATSDFIIVEGYDGPQPGD